MARRRGPPVVLVVLGLLERIDLLRRELAVAFLENLFAVGIRTGKEIGVLLQELVHRGVVNLAVRPSEHRAEHSALPVCLGPVFERVALTLVHVIPSLLAVAGLWLCRWLPGLCSTSGRSPVSVEKRVAELSFSAVAPFVAFIVKTVTSATRVTDGNIP